MLPAATNPTLTEPSGDWVLYAEHVYALRACERRVAEETEAAMIESFYWKPSPPHDRHYFADNICAYCVGYSEALSAAREAVKHLQHSDDCYYAEGVLCHCEIKRVITAIDALRKEPQ